MMYYIKECGKNINIIYIDFMQSSLFSVENDEIFEFSYGLSDQGCKSFYIKQSQQMGGA